MQSQVLSPIVAKLAASPSWKGFKEAERSLLGPLLSAKKYFQSAQHLPKKALTEFKICWDLGSDKKLD